GLASCPPVPCTPLFRSVESRPLEVTGRIKTISEGRYRNKGPMYAGVAMDMGTAVVLDTGRVEIVIISRHVEPHDINVLLSLGIRSEEHTSELQSRENLV